MTDYRKPQPLRCTRDQSRGVLVIAFFCNFRDGNVQTTPFDALCLADSLIL